MVDETSPAATPSRIEQALLEGRMLLGRGDPAGSLRIADAVLAEVPRNRDALYLAAVCHRYLNGLGSALDVLERMEAEAPDHARLHQERGHCHRARGDRLAATASYERAVMLNAALPASWQALVALYQATGRLEDAARARDHVEHLANMPAPLVSVSALINEGDLFHAERLCRHFLQTQGHHLEGMRLLADIGVRLDVLDDAEFLLESVVEFAPDYHAARYEYAVVLAKRQKFAKALEQARVLRGVDPENRAYEALYAAQCAGIGHHAAAIDAYEALLSALPQDPYVALSLGHARRSFGQQPAAIDAYREAAVRKPDFGDAYWSLANLKTYRFQDEELDRMREHEIAGTTSIPDRYHLCFALGKALEDRHEYAESFAYYDRGNALKRQEIRYSADLMERDLGLQARVCTEEFLSSRANAGCPSRDPIFIVGLPRAGSTLLEQILASHSKVEGTMELPNIRVFAHHLDGRRRSDDPPRYPGSLAGLSPAKLLELGEKYIADTRVYRSGAPMFIDKMPNNFRHLGLISLILPNAKIIDARRDAMGCCFGGFKQLFAAGQEFTYGLDDIGRYYRNYVDLMAHWDAVLPGRILRVQYEQVVEDVESSVRRILDFCELEFEEACLDFHRTQRSVRTASSEQVRQPLFREGLLQWRHYERHLGPLRDALGPLAAT